MKQSTNKLLLAYFIYNIRIDINSAKLQNTKKNDVVERMCNENLIISPKLIDVGKKLEKIFSKQIEEFKIL